MPKLLWIGSPFFCHELAELGYELIFHNFEDLRLYNWADLVTLAGGEPDIIVVADKSRPPFVLGQEKFPCLTVCYAVDTHIHSYLPWYAQSFDLCLVSLKDHIPTFYNKILKPEQIFWSPPFATYYNSEPDFYASKNWPCLFVGRVNQATTPRRLKILQELGELVQVQQGNYTKFYPQAEIVLNISEYGDMNFRIFEALGSGSCLLTPDIAHGLADLFSSQDLCTYANNNVESIKEKIKFLLDRQELRLNLAKQGWEKVGQFHLVQHRAQAFANLLAGLPKNFFKQRLEQAKYIHSSCLRMLYLHLAESMSEEKLKLAYAQAARA